MTEPAAGVARSTLDHQVDRALAEVGSPAEGLFGPDSVVWKVARHTVVNLGATGLGGVVDGAHPWIAQGVADHSRLFSDPHKRFEGTYSLLNRLVFGDAELVRKVSRALHGMHARVEGTLPESAARFEAGSTYRANHVEALLWVYLVYFRLRKDLYQRLVGDLDTTEWDQYAREATRFGACFGIPLEALPQDDATLADAYDRVVSSDLMGPSAALDQILDHLHHLLPAPARPGFDALAIDVLPQRLHPVLGLDRRRFARRLCRPVVWTLKLIVALMPASLRYLPAYHEAQHRLGGPRPGRLTRFLNSRLMGRPTVLS